MDDKRINEIWNSNSKIPFLQSKEILRLGYEFGYNDSKKNPKKDNIQKCKSEEYDSGKTSREMIKYAENQINISKKAEHAKEQIKEELIVDTKIKTLADILTYMKDPKHDYIGLFAYIKNEIDKLQTRGTYNWL